MLDSPAFLGYLLYAEIVALSARDLDDPHDEYLDKPSEPYVRTLIHSMGEYPRHNQSVSLHSGFLLSFSGACYYIQFLLCCNCVASQSLVRSCHLDKGCYFQRDK